MLVQANRKELEQIYAKTLETGNTELATKQKSVLTGLAISYPKDVETVMIVDDLLALFEQNVSYEAVYLYGAEISLVHYNGNELQLAIKDMIEHMSKNYDPEVDTGIIFKSVDGIRDSRAVFSFEEYMQEQESEDEEDDNE